jgi:hypothetical protein
MEHPSHDALRGARAPGGFRRPLTAARYPNGSTLMNKFQRAIKWIMLVSGLLTCTTAFALFASDASLRSTFDVSLSNPMTLIVVRHWGALVGLFGIMLIYGAFEESVRRMVLLAASAGKAIFISLVLSYGHHVVSQAGPGVMIDTISVLLFVVYLTWSRKPVAAGTGLLDHRQRTHTAH